MTILNYGCFFYQDILKNDNIELRLFLSLSAHLLGGTLYFIMTLFTLALFLVFLGKVSLESLG